MAMGANGIFTFPFGKSHAGQLAYMKAIKTWFNIDIDLRGYSTSGKTDILILQELLEIYSIDVDSINRNELV